MFSPEKLSTLTLKNLRRFDAMTRTFQDKEFTEQFGKDKVEKYVRQQRMIRRKEAGANTGEIEGRDFVDIDQMESDLTYL